MKIKPRKISTSSSVQHIIRMHPVTTFYLLAFVISWIGFLPVIAGSRGFSFFQHSTWMVFLILPAIGPALAALITTSLENTNSGGLLAFRENIMKHVSWSWYFIAILLPVIIQFAANKISKWLMPGHLPIIAASSVLGILSVAAMSLGSNPWEEVGWRGFALTRLQAKYNPSVAALIIGVLWGLWHIPLFLWTDYPMAKISFWVWFPGIIGQSFIYAWVFNSSGRSLTVVIVLHLTSNIFGAIIGNRSNVILSLVEVGTAILILIIYGSQLGSKSAVHSSNIQ